MENKILMIKVYRVITANMYEVKSYLNSEFYITADDHNVTVKQNNTGNIFFEGSLKYFCVTRE